MKYDEKKIEFSPDWKGPVEDRRSTDVPFLVIFGIFMVVWFGIGCYALSTGDLKDISKPLSKSYQPHDDWSSDNYQPRDDGPSKNIMQTVIKSSYMIVAMMVVGAAMCLAYIFVLKYFALQMVILSVIIWCSLLCYLAYYSYRIYVETNASELLVYIVLLALMVIFIIVMVIWMFKKIRSACLLIKEASVAVTSILSSLLCPILQWLLHLVAIIYAIAVLLHLSTIKDQATSMITFFYCVHVIGSIWLHCFITALGEMILAGTFASWYWTFRKSEVSSYVVARSASRTIRYHLGTIALGSLLLTICRVIRYCLESLRHARDSHAVCALVSLLCCITILMEILESFIKFVNRNAYIYCSIYGKGLCSSASDALSLILRNALRCVVLNNVVSWVLWLGQVSICGLLGLITWSHYSGETSKEVNLWVPVTLVVVLGYLLTTAFFSLYEVAVETIFLCFLEDCERNDGSLQRPYYMSLQLRKLLYKEQVTESRTEIVE